MSRLTTWDWIETQERDALLALLRPHYGPESDDEHKPAKTAPELPETLPSPYEDVNTNLDVSRLAEAMRALIGWVLEGRSIRGQALRWQLLAWGVGLRPAVETFEAMGKEYQVTRAEVVRLANELTDLFGLSFPNQKTTHTRGKNRERATGKKKIGTLWQTK